MYQAPPLGSHESVSLSWTAASIIAASSIATIVIDYDRGVWEALSERDSAARNTLVICVRHGTVGERELYRMPRLLERRLFARIVASVVLFALLVWRIDVAEAGRALRDADYVYAIPALLLFRLAKLPVAQRWRLMMPPFPDLPLPPLFGILLVS